MDALADDEFARNYRLAQKLEQVHSCMESIAWSCDLAPASQNKGLIQGVLSQSKTCFVWSFGGETPSHFYMVLNQGLGEGNYNTRFPKEH